MKSIILFYFLIPQLYEYYVYHLTTAYLLYYTYRNLINTALIVVGSYESV